MSLNTLKFVALAVCGVVMTAGLAGHLIHAAPASRTAVPGTFRSTDASSRAGRSAMNLDPLHRFFAHVLIQLGIGHGAGEPVVEADDQNDDKPVLAGVWVKKEGELKLDFTEKDAVIITPHGENKVVVIRCEAMRDKDRVVKAKIADIEGKEEAVKLIKEKLPVGTEFTFKWSVTKDSAKLEDLKGEKIDVFKSHLEGEFERK